MHATTTRTLETGVADEGVDVDTNAVEDTTSGAGQTAAVHRRICVPRLVRRTSYRSAAAAAEAKDAEFAAPFETGAAELSTMVAD